MIEDMQILQNFRCVIMCAYTIILFKEPFFPGWSICVEERLYAKEEKRRKNVPTVARSF